MEKAFNFDYEVQDKDIILLFSDGVSDNLSDEFLARCVDAYIKDDQVNPIQQCQACANKIARWARYMGK